jgi:flagellar basal body-associated protein FliL
MALMSLEEVTQNITTPDRSLLYHILVQLMENNRLLTQLVEKPKEAEAVKIVLPVLKRSELMELVKKKNPPRGWIKWSNEKMLEFTKEV